MMLGTTFFTTYGITFVAIGRAFKIIDVNIFDPLISSHVICTFNNFKSAPLFLPVLIICAFVNATISYIIFYKT